MGNRGWGLKCNCGIYPHPHRLGGGKCNGAEWVQAYFLYSHEQCPGCPYNDKGMCNFESEALNECRGYLDLKERGDQIELPFSDEELETMIIKK